MQLRPPFLLRVQTVLAALGAAVSALAADAAAAKATNAAKRANAAKATGRPTGGGRSRGAGLHRRPRGDRDGGGTLDNEVREL